MRGIVSLFIVLTGAVAVLSMGGCERNATFRNTIRFTGNVYTGHKDAASGTIIGDAPAADARVVCTNTNDYAKTAANGSYTLEVTTVRTYQGNDTEAFQISASSLSGLDETITVNAKPGDTVNVRTLVLTKHTEGQ